MLLGVLVLTIVLKRSFKALHGLKTPPSGVQVNGSATFADCVRLKSTSKTLDPQEKKASGGKQYCDSPVTFEGGTNGADDHAPERINLPRQSATALLLRLWVGYIFGIDYPLTPPRIS
eukprot:Tbor_TRINITY_DN2986_c0_g1::TRINITY_DN2986_c0_g1_i1::g.1203::m.1203